VSPSFKHSVVGLPFACIESPLPNSVDALRLHSPPRHRPTMVLPAGDAWRVAEYVHVQCRRARRSSRGHRRFRRCSSHIGWRCYRRVSPGRNALLISSFISDFSSCGVDFDLCCLYTWVHVFTVRTSTSALGSVNHDEMVIQGYLILCFQYRSWTLLNLLIF
jgi:hypothetical protein